MLSWQFMAFDRGDLQMKFSKKSRYGLTALIDLAINSENSKVTLASIARRNNISLQFLEQIFAALRRADIVKGVKGPQGGYIIKEDLSNISLADILIAVDGTYYLEEEVAKTAGGPELIASTIQEAVVDRINEKLDEILNGIKLKELVDLYKEKGNIEQQMYYI